MTETQEFNAVGVDEAVEKAANRLGISAADLSYEVIDPGSAGFLGLGARDARIRVDVAGAEEDFHEGPAVPDEIQDTMDGSEVPMADERHANGQPSVEDSTFEEKRPDETTSNAVGPAPQVEDSLLEEIRQFMDQALDAIDLDARVEVYDAGEMIAVDVVTEETGLFIGQKGETIDALQYLANISVYRGRPFDKRIVVDSEGYRQRRVEAIEGMAHRSARKVVREQRTLELPPMNSAERRIVHLYLQHNDEVVTASEGSGQSRRVKITPSQ